MPGETIWGMPWLLLAGAALALAVIFLFVGPAGDVTSLRGLVVRFGHSACWLLLALSALAMARVAPVPATAAQPLAAAGGLAYVGFLAATLLPG